MKWSEIDSAFVELKANLSDVGTRIETAIKNHGQLYHANHKPWYTKKIRIVRLRFLVLKRRLGRLSGFPIVFEKLDAQLRVLNDVSNDASKLRDSYRDASWSVKSLGRQVRRRKEEDFDVFTTHRGEVSIDRKLCFVMIPFRREFNPVYAAIRKAVTSRGLKCRRSKDVFNTRAVILDIWENIRKSMVCIADTSPPNNPNVFYEIGMAHSLPKRVILISRKLRHPEEQYPFDMNYVRCIFYRQNASGYGQLERDISRTLRTILQ